VVILPQVHAPPGTNRVQRVDYLHEIHPFAKKPQAFRRGQLLDDIMLSDNYRALWTKVYDHIQDLAACKWMRVVLRLGYS
jgi:hypothetical protein